MLPCAPAMGNRPCTSAVIVLASAIACHQDTADPANASSTSSGEEPTTIVPTDPSTVGSSTAPGSSDASTGSSSGVDSSEAGSETGEPGSACDDYDAFVDQLQDAADDPARIALADAFVRAAQFSEHGLPLVCDGRMIALAWHDGADTLAITGDFADWDPRAHPMTPVVGGFALHVADITVDDPLAPSLYKLVDGGTSYRADPLARRFGWDEFGEYSLTDARSDAGHHERWPAFDEGAGLLAARDVVVYLPAGVLQRRELAVLYMHDGQNLFAPDAFFGGWRVAAAVDDAIASGAIAPLLVVGIDNTPARFDEYTHVPDDLGDGPVGGRADEYADFLALGLKPFIDARYPTRVERDGNAVLGSSLGGLVSLYIGLRHPDVFTAVGSMSGTLGWGRMGGRMGAGHELLVELYEADPPDDLWVYLDSGGDGSCPRADSDNYCVTIDMRDRLAALGWNEPDTLVYAHAPGASHDEAAWAARLPGFLAALGDRLPRG